MIEVHLMDIIWHGHSCFELVSGERRLRAARMAGLSEVPCIVIDVDGVCSSLLALVENLQRRDLDFLEEAMALDRLIHTYDLSQEEAARRIGKSQSAVANKLRLLKLSPRLLDRLRQNGLTERHARALLRLETEEQQWEVLEYVIDHHLTVAQTEAYIEARLTPPPPRKKKPTFILKDALSQHRDQGAVHDEGCRGERGVWPAGDGGRHPVDHQDSQGGLVTGQADRVSKERQCFT